MMHLGGPACELQRILVLEASLSSALAAAPRFRLVLDDPSDSKGIFGSVGAVDMVHMPEQAWSSARPRCACSRTATPWQARATTARLRVSILEFLISLVMVMYTWAWVNSAAMGRPSCCARVRVGVSVACAGTAGCDLWKEYGIYLWLVHLVMAEVQGRAPYCCGWVWLFPGLAYAVAWLVAIFSKVTFENFAISYSQPSYPRPAGILAYICRDGLGRFWDNLTGFSGMRWVRTVILWHSHRTGGTWLYGCWVLDLSGTALGRPQAAGVLCLARGTYRCWVLDLSGTASGRPQAAGVRCWTRGTARAQLLLSFASDGGTSCCLCGWRVGRFGSVDMPDGLRKRWSRAGHDSLNSERRRKGGSAGRQVLLEPSNPLPSSVTQRSTQHDERQMTRAHLTHQAEAQPVLTCSFRTQLTATGSASLGAHPDTKKIPRALCNVHMRVGALRCAGQGLAARLGQGGKPGSRVRAVHAAMVVWLLVSDVPASQHEVAWIGLHEDNSQPAGHATVLAHVLLPTPVAQCSQAAWQRPWWLVYVQVRACARCPFRVAWLAALFPIFSSNALACQPPYVWAGAGARH